MPAGAFLAARIDTNHWLSAGCPEPLPILAGRDPVLMAADGVEAPFRFGHLITVTNPPAKSDKSDKSDRSDKSDKSDNADKAPNDHPEPARVGWCALPPDTAMQLRLSGLVWPEATHRLANSAWVTREGIGRGQLILFASSPTFRAGARGTTRVFLNAVVLGPGLGAQSALHP